MKDNADSPHCESDSESALSSNNKLGRIFTAFLNTIKGFPDPALFALIKTIASSSPSPTDVEVAWHLLGKWNNAGLTVPRAIPPAPPLSFPHDHGLHLDMGFEWHFLTLSLDLDSGGRISAVIIIFRKSIGSPASKSKLISRLDQQIFSTSLGITLELPQKPPTHYAYPVLTYAPAEGGVHYIPNPFHLSVGPNAIKGSSNMFPLDLHIDGQPDPLLARPHIQIDVHCAARNPLFLQGLNGYVPSGPSSGWYYYSWANQPTTGTITIDNKTFSGKGLAWMDHQWGGAAVPAPSDPYPPKWSGWCWFEFQFDGGSALTGFCGHDGLVNGILPGPIRGIGSYVRGGSSTLVEVSLSVPDKKYAKSPDTDANYPMEWKYTIKNVEIALEVSATTVCEQQALWQGGLNEYAEAVVTVSATGTIKGESVTLTGVGFCESVAFEDPVETATRQKTWLHSSLQKHGGCHTQ